MGRRPAFLIATRDALRTYWGSALLILVAGAAALAVVIPIARLARSINDLSPRLRLSTIRGSSLGFHWGSNAATPANTQAEAITLLFQLLLVAGFATLLLAGLSILSISAARASARFPEISVRRAVGASRRALLWGALAEGSMIGAGAVFIGIVAGGVGMMAALADWPGTINQGSAGPVVVAILAVPATIIVGSLFQLLSTPPRRIAEPNPQPLELYIPALQLGMGLTVLVASAMLVRHATGLVNLNNQALDNGVVVELTSPELSTRERASRYQALLEHIRRDRGVEAASIMSPGTLVGLGISDAITTDCGFCSDGGVVIKWHLVFTTHQFVSSDTFGALGIERIEGRLLSDEDRWDTAPAAVISQSLARRHFQDGKAIGRQVLLNLDRPEWYTVVGVVEDREPEGFGGAIQPRSVIYLSVLQHPPTEVDLLVQTADGFSAEGVERTVSRLGLTGNNRPVSARTAVAREARPLAWFGRWFSLLGWAMLGITTVSTFVLMRLWVRSLRPELGLRRAAGARRLDLVRYILVRAMLTGLAGVGIALWFGPALWDSLPEMVAGLPGWNLGVVAPPALILFIIALAGALLPALQAGYDSPTGLMGSIGE